MNRSPHTRPRQSSAVWTRRIYCVATAFFVITALLGVALRWLQSHPIAALQYDHLLHAHSHIAFLGWVFNAFFALTLSIFAFPDQRRYYLSLFAVSQISILGMLVSFPWQGYALWSISFSALHMLCSALFAIKLWKRSQAGKTSRAYLRVALAAMLLSSLGPLALGPLAAMEMRTSPWYTLAIYFYLHFQYNGWFVFFLLAVAFRFADSAGIRYPEKSARASLVWLAVGCLLSYTLSTLWAQPPHWLQWLALLGGISQLMGCSGLVICAQNIARAPQMQNRGLVGLLVRIAFFCLVAKFVLQVLAALPGLSSLAFNRFAAIGFLHLVFLGIVTPLLVAWAIASHWLPWNRWSQSAVLIYLAGSLLTEFVLFYQAAAGSFHWPSWPMLQGSLQTGSVLLLLAALLLFAQSAKGLVHGR